MGSLHEHSALRDLERALSEPASAPDQLRELDHIAAAAARVVGALVWSILARELVDRFPLSAAERLAPCLARLDREAELALAGMRDDILGFRLPAPIPRRNCPGRARRARVFVSAPTRPAYAARLQLSTDPLALVEARAVSGEALLVIDGLDRIQDSRSVGILNDLLAAIARSPAAARWRFLVSSRHLAGPGDRNRR